ncbi:hypothetical protein [Nonomuraea aurantiaca]|uniref:hypothetical protein n=1 Tax=Nonomuraea aurantiaca TaxID=2878562 RepID=UPI001CD9362F|nr:hypothetical protein [Nonomuraea aurantiaca]MCA2227885.1 hypothetical protein [Nonomuraea aurantiaca]
MSAKVRGIEAASPTKSPPTGRGSGPLERVTVNLNERSSRALEEVVNLRGDTKTDAINRALQMYSLIEHILQSGGKVYVQEAGQTELERVRFF